MVLKCPIRYGTWLWVMAVSHFWLKNRKLLLKLCRNQRKLAHSSCKAPSLWLQKQICDIFSVAVVNSPSTRASFTHNHTHTHTRAPFFKSKTLMGVPLNCRVRGTVCKEAHFLSELSLSCTWMRNPTVQVVLYRQSPWKPTHTCYCA